MKLQGQKHNQDSSSLSKESSRLKIIILVFIVIIVSVGTGYYILEYKNTKTHHYNYTNLQTYSLPGNVPGSGLSFIKPAEFFNYSQAPGQMVFAQPVASSSNNQSQIAYLAAASTTVADAYTPSQLSALKANLAYPDDNYNSVISPINQFIKDRLPSSWQIKLANSKPFTNANIKDNAWEFDFSASDPIDKKNSFKGEVLYAISGKNYYYFMLATVSDNWQSNQKIWQQVIDSLKINQ